MHLWRSLTPKKKRLYDILGIFKTCFSNFQISDNSFVAMRVCKKKTLCDHITIVVIVYIDMISSRIQYNKLSTSQQTHTKMFGNSFFFAGTLSF